MKTIFAAVLTAVVLHAAPTFAKSPTVSPPVGRWAIDVATLPMPPEARPEQAQQNGRPAFHSRAPPGIAMDSARSAPRARLPEVIRKNRNRGQSTCR